MSKYYSSSIAFGAEQTKTEQVVVSPTKIGNVTTDAVSGALTVDEVPVLNSLNPVSSDGVARAVIQAGAEIPTRGSEDTGKVLTVANSDGDLEWDTPEGGIPDMTGKNGKVLGAVDNGGTMEAQWVNPPDSYPSVTGNAGKVLKVNAGATGVEWADESTATVDQNYNASSTNAQSGTAVAEALGTVKQVPAASSGDFDKILGVTDTSGTVGWVSKPASVSVDQNYNPYSDNAQSGTAVAGALETIKQVPASTAADENKVLSVNAQGAPEWVTPSGGAQYSAGDGIAIDGNNAISADVDGTTIGIDASTKKIKSLQVIPSKTSDLQNDSGYITSSDIPAQVNADWTSNSGASEILHKPDLSIYAQSANLATVATTGDYSDLVNKPAIPAAQVNSDWNASSGVAAILNKPSLATVATTGDYSDLQNKPSIPAAQVNADWNASSGIAEILNKPSLATVATTGAYSDLTGTPTIPSVDQTYDASSTNAQSGVAVASAISGVNAVPASTSVDSGKVLTVDSLGAPVWSNAGGAFEIIEWSSATYNLVKAAYDAGKQPVILDKTTYSSQPLYGYLVAQEMDPYVPTRVNTFRFLSIKSIGSYSPSDQSATTIQYIVPWSGQKFSAEAKAAATFTSDSSVTLTQDGVGQIKIAVANPLPASTAADEDKVLTVNSSGEPVWATSSVPSSKPLVAGANITITDGASDVTIAATVPSVDQTYDASSANAQSGVAVASAISGINAVPASTSADQDKVLTVNSSGTPVWAAAQGGGGSGGDSEFPYDPGFMHTGWCEMIVRFGDTSYDPTTKSSASMFASIVAMNEPGVYKFTMDFDSGWKGSGFLASEWNDYTNNPIDVLQFTGPDYGLTRFSNTYTNFFYNCTGLRSVWNIRGPFGEAHSMFEGCTNLQIVSGKINEFTRSYQENMLYDWNAGFGVRSNSSRMFYGCGSLKRVETVLTAINGDNVVELHDMFGGLYGASVLEVGPGVYGNIGLAYAFQSCYKLEKLYGEEDIAYYHRLFNREIFTVPPSTPAISFNYAFSGCPVLRTLGGAEFTGYISNIGNAFENCKSLLKVPTIMLKEVSGDSMSASGAFQNCTSLTEVPDINYSIIKDASQMFSGCYALTSVKKLLPLSNACTNCNYLLHDCKYVLEGVSELYTALSQSASISSHDETFHNTGIGTWNDVHSQIPSSWGGTGA